MSLLGSLRRWLLEAPDEVPWRERKWFVVRNVTLALGAIAHVALFVLFAAVGVPWLAAYAALAFALMVGLIVANWRGYRTLTVVIGTLEANIHNVACSLLLGFDSGFYYYGFTLAVVPLVAFETDRRGLKALFVAIGLAGFAVEQAVALPPERLVILSPAVLSVVHATNAAIGIGMTVGIAYYVVREALRAEAEVESLLHNIMPAPVADRLLADDRAIAEGFDGVTVLFADLAGFTTWSAGRPPAEVVDLLNDVFSRFDALTDRHGVEKIKTIGDAYMAACGLPARSPDHVARVADLALDMLAEAEKVWAARGLDLEVRIGIHTGPAVAGVIGTRRFLYDLWGDVVNTASRMESQGLPGAIQVTDAVRAGLAGRFRLDERGTIDVKGKGPMRTWLLRGRAGSMAP